MMEAKNKISSHWWWFDGEVNSNNHRRSPWLQSTLAELNDKTKAMLKLIEEDADSFAQRAEMYYKKRPELIDIVEDFYRAHRSLAERYDQVKSDSGVRLFTPLASSLSFSKYRTDRLITSMDKCYDSYSETFDPEESAESEVEDPDDEADQVCEKEEETSSGVRDNEMLTVKEEMERIIDENKILKEQLVQKDEEKREAIRQLSLAVYMLKEENAELRKKKYVPVKEEKNSSLQFKKMKEVFLGKLFNLPRRTQEAALVAL